MGAMHVGTSAHWADPRGIDILAVVATGKLQRRDVKCVRAREKCVWGAAKGSSDEIRWFGSCHKGAHQPMFVGAWNTLLCLEGDAFRAATYVLKTWHEKANDTTSGKNVCCDGIPLQRPAIAAVHDLVLHVVGPGGYERALRSWIMRVRRVRGAHTTR